jgi:HTH-type transcriptional regulator / antitoxin HigA
MEQRELQPVDLVGVIGSETRVFEVVNGDRDIAKELALILGNFFHVEPSLFCN